MSERNLSVLVVDDEPMVRSLLKRSLAAHGISAWTAANGREAIELYWLHRAQISMVFLDVCMPQMDGPTTARALKDIDPQVRFCFLSGCYGSYSAEGLLSLGALELFSKPFVLAELIESIEESALLRPLASVRRLLGPGLPATSGEMLASSTGGWS
jgi:CheY-like chemotaxis protein